MSAYLRKTEALNTVPQIRRKKRPSSVNGPAAKDSPEKHAVNEVPPNLEGAGKNDHIETIMDICKTVQEKVLHKQIEAIKQKIADKPTKQLIIHIPYVPFIEPKKDYEVDEAIEDIFLELWKKVEKDNIVIQEVQHGSTVNLDRHNDNTNNTDANTNTKANNNNHNQNNKNNLLPPSPKKMVDASVNKSQQATMEPPATVRKNAEPNTVEKRIIPVTGSASTDAKLRALEMNPLFAELYKQTMASGMDSSSSTSRSVSKVSLLGSASNHGNLKKMTYPLQPSESKKVTFMPCVDDMQVSSSSAPDCQAIINSMVDKIGTFDKIVNGGNNVTVNPNETRSILKKSSNLTIEPDNNVHHVHSFDCCCIDCITAYLN